MKQSYPYWVFFSLTVAPWLLSSCAEADSASQFNSALTSRIHAGEQDVPVADLTLFEWDRVYFLGAYSRSIENRRRKQLSDLIGFEYNGVVPDLDGDGAWALLFVSDAKEQARLIEIERKVYQLVRYDSIQTAPFSQFGHRCRFVIESRAGEPESSLYMTLQDPQLGMPNGMPPPE